MLKIAIQGVKGCFHHLALSTIYKNNNEYTIYECNTFIELVNIILNKEVDLGIMAIENSIVGDIISNYILLYKNKLKIISEILIPISHQLLGLFNQNIYDINEIISHPMAISQCEYFFKKYPHIKSFDYYDTAGAAKFISYNKIKGKAAIAPIISANIYKLNIIESNINSNKNNFTRFFIIKNINKYIANNNFNKSSIILELFNNNTLSKVIDIIYNNNIIILKIQSLPSGHTNWNYVFLFEIIFFNIDIYIKIKKIILKIVKKLYVIGEYQNVQKI